jgi:hypothetical protein
MSRSNIDQRGEGGSDKALESTVNRNSRLIGVRWFGSLLNLLNELLWMSGLIQYLEARILVCFGTHFFCNAFQHPQQLGVFLFGEQIDLQIQVVTPLAELRFMVLTDENEGRQENGFQRDHEGEKGKWIGVEMFQAVQGIENYPGSEPDHVHPDKDHTATKAGDLISQATGLRTTGLGGVFQSRDRFHVAFSNVIDRARLVIAGIKWTG